MVAGVTLTASGQEGVPTPGQGEVKYYQGKVSPPPAGLFPGAPRAATPPALPPSANVPSYAGKRPGDKPPAVPVPKVPGAISPTDPASPVVPAGGVPRLTQPVVAGPGGVTTVGAMEAPTATSAGSPTFFAPTLPKPGSVPPPAAGLPEPKPLPPSVNVDAPAPLMPVPDLPAMPIKPTPVLKPTVAVEPTPPATTPIQPIAPTGVPASTPRLAREPVMEAAPEATTPRQVPNVLVEAVFPETVGINQQLVYEVVVRNVGTGPVANVRVEDELPAKCTFLASNPPAETSGDRMTWSIGAMEAGAEKRISVTVKPTEEGEIRSRAVVSFTTAVVARVKVTRPRIEVAVTGAESARVGEKVSYQIKLTNVGSGTAGKVLLQARFSDGLAHPQGQLIEAELANLAAGDSKPLVVEVTAMKSGPQVCTITAAADGAPAETAKSNTSVVEPMLTVKQSGPAHCLVRAEPVYTVELANPGTAATDTLQVWAALPPGLEFAAASDGGTFQDANRAVGWRLAGLAPGTKKTVTMTLRAVSPTEGAVRTVAQVVPPAAEVTQAGAKPAAKPLEASAETVVRAEGVPALRFEVFDLEDPVILGKEAAYEIRVINQGTGPCTNVQIVAELADTTSVSAAPTGPTAAKVAGQQVTFEPIPELAVKGEAVFRVRVKGSQPGDFRFRVKLTCSEIRVGTIKEENSRFYKE
jgi:uncharacterized repeat protein (TIGR01451 family)